MKLNNFFRKLQWKIKLGWYSLFYGMKAGNDLLSNGNKDANEGVSNEEHIKQNNVWASLIKGEMTQEVKDLVYETNVAYRKSMGYDASKPGYATKKNSMLKLFSANIENKENREIVIVQNNIQYDKGITDTLEDCTKGIDSEPEYVLKIGRKYFSRFLLERYAQMFVAKRVKDNLFELDFYVPKGPKENDPKSIYFDQEMKNLFQAKSRTSDIVDIDSVHFTTEKAWPVDDLLYFEFVDLKYLMILEYNGSYILRFSANGKTLGEDILTDILDEKAKEKFDKKAPRKKKNKNYITIGAAQDLIQEQENKENFDVEKAKEIMGKIKKENENSN